MKKLVVFFISFFLLFNLFSSPSLAVDEPSVCAVYFTGIGCPHCAKVDPVVLNELVEEYPNLVIIEYEIYQERENALLLYEYNEVYGSGLGIPLIIFDGDNFLVGDAPILRNVRDILDKKEGSPCPLIDGSAVGFTELDLSRLPGKPKIWPESEKPASTGEVVSNDLTLAKVLSLAAVDAINPCALAVLTLMLFAILAFAPKKRRNILLAGLAFSAAVFIMYLFYGLLIVRFFQLVKALTSIRLWLYKILGLAAVILGILNLRDFIRYKPGGFLTEMPMFLRPKMQNLMFKVASPKGAFLVGAAVTLFLLPCTIGPYVICGGILCTLSFLETLPWLLIYNFIFILPMLAITGACYFGFTTVEDVSEWRQKNIRWFHLVAGVIIFVLGLAMLLGWV